MKAEERCTVVVGCRHLFCRRQPLPFLCRRPSTGTRRSTVDRHSRLDCPGPLPFFAFFPFSPSLQPHPQCELFDTHFSAVRTNPSTRLSTDHNNLSYPVTTAPPFRIPHHVYTILRCTGVSSIVIPHRSLESTFLRGIFLYRPFPP